jgi:hypothetical protein
LGKALVPLIPSPTAPLLGGSNNNLTNEFDEFSEVVKVHCQRVSQFKSTFNNKHILLILLMLDLCGVSGF